MENSFFCSGRFFGSSRENRPPFREKFPKIEKCGSRGGKLSFFDSYGANFLNSFLTLNPK